MRRLILLMGAPLLALMLTLGIASPAAASAVGYWTATDVDGSHLRLWVYSTYYTYSLDDSASVCGGVEAKVYGPGTFYPASNKLIVQWSVSCFDGPLLGPFTITLVWDGANTMTDSTGVTWHRS